MAREDDRKAAFKKGRPEIELENMGWS